MSNQQEAPYIIDGTDDDTMVACLMAFELYEGEAYLMVWDGDLLFERRPFQLGFAGIENPEKYKYGFQFELQKPLEHYMGMLKKRK